MPNPHLYQSIAVLAGEMGYLEEARRWFREGTRSIKGKQSHALWHAWAILEAQQVTPLGSCCQFQFSHVCLDDSIRLMCENLLTAVKALP